MGLNKYIDHTILKATASSADVQKLCEEAIEHEFYSVCVNGCYVADAKHLLQGADVKVAAVVGFPLGAMTTASKVFEAKEAIENGASEIDMVINVAKLKDGEFDYVENEIRLIKEAIGDNVLKVIIETCYLTDEEKVKLMPLLMEPDFMNFLTEVIPCLYGEVENGRLVQNELTAETASLAPWFGDLIDIGFFSDLFYEFNRSRTKVPQDRKKPQQKS